MAFWSKWLKREGKNNEQDSLETEIVQEPINYTFQFVMTDQTQQKRIIEAISPIIEQNQILNLRLAYGVLESATGIFVADVRSESYSDDNTGVRYNKNSLVALIGDECVPISYTYKEFDYEGEATYEAPEQYEYILIPAMDFWRTLSNWKEFEKKLEEEQGICLLKLNSDLRRPLYDFIPDPKTMEKKHFEVKSVEDAKTLFYLCDTDCYRKMKERYDEATIAAFGQYADKPQKVKWIVEECEGILQQIIDGDLDKLYKKLSTISGKCEYWLSDPDDFVEKYMEACKVIFASDVYVPIDCITNYLGKFNNRFRPVRAKELMAMAEAYVEKTYPEEYAKKYNQGVVGDFKKVCCQLKGKIAETSPMENANGFRYVEVQSEMLQEFVDFYQEKYHDVEATKECLVELNCVYGVQNEEIFLTSNNYTANSTGRDYSSDFKFLAVMLKDKLVLELECERDLETGKIMLPDYIADDVKAVANEAIAYFRNELARNAFVEEYAKTHDGENPQYLVGRATEKFLRSLGSSFPELEERIGDNPLADTLREFIELCEHKVPEIGSGSIIIGEPATDEEIAAWQQNHGIMLPESYCQFLKFANGFAFRGSSEYIVGLEGIEPDCEHLEPDYMSIGGIIGDGTTLCMSKSTGDAYVEDHGEYECYGDFRQLLDYVIEFAFG